MFKLKNNYSVASEVFPESNADLDQKIQVYYDENNYNYLIACALELIKRTSETLDENTLEGWTWQPLALAFTKMGEVEAANFCLNKALAYYNETLETYPDDGDTNFKLAAINALAKNINASKKFIEKLIFQNPAIVLEAYFEPSFEGYKNDPDWIDFLFGNDNRIERIKVIAENQKGNYGYDEEKFNKGFHYILNETSKLPPAFKDYYESNMHSCFIGFLAPLELWNDLDKRIIEVMKTNFMHKAHGYFEGLYGSLCDWSKSYYDYSKNELILEHLFEALKPYKFKENEIFIAYLDSAYFELYHYETYKITPWGKMLMETILDPNISKPLLKQINERHENSTLDILLLAYDQKLFEQKVLSKTLNYKEKSIPYTFCHYELVYALVAVDFEKYKDIVLQAYLNTNESYCLRQLNYSIKTAFPNGKEIIINHSKEVAEYLYKNPIEDLDNQVFNVDSNPFYIVQDLYYHEDIKDEIKDWVFGWFSKFKDLDIYSLENFHSAYKENSVQSFIEYWKNNEFPGKSIWTLLSAYDLTPYHSLMREKLKAKAKFGNEICKILAKNGDSEIDFALELCNGKTIDLRKSGISLLSFINTPASIAKIEGFLEKETNDDIRDLIFETVVGMKPEINQNLTIQDVQKRVENADKLGKLKKVVRPWLDEKLLPELFWNNGSKLSELEVRYLLYRQSRSSEMMPELEAKPMYELIDLSKSIDFGEKLWEMYFQNSAQAKDKFVLVPAAYFGGDEMVAIIMKQIKTWCDESRGKMAENLALALGTIGTKKSLRAIDELSRKYKTKQKNVGESAMKAFENAAIVMNLTAFELADKIIPNFDFENNYENLVIKEKNYRAFVDASFEMVFMDDNGKKIKKLPAGADKETVDRFKLISKELKEALKFIKPRMEFYMVVQRRWPISEWKELYLVNPVVFPFTLSTVWGLFENGVLKTTFTSLDDCSLVDVNYEPIEMTDNQEIGIVHPLELNEEIISDWTTYMIDNKIEQAFAQLSRPIFQMTDEKKLCKFDKSYIDTNLNSGKFVRMLDNLGWRKGSIVDGGTISSYYKTFKNNNITAFINFEGYISVGYYDDYGDDLSIGAVYFVPMGSVSVGSYSYDEPYNDSDKRLLTFESIPTIVYSEVMSDIQTFVEKAKLEE